MPVQGQDMLEIRKFSRYLLAMLHVAGRLVTSFWVAVLYMSATAQAQSLTYSEDFVVTTTYGAGSTQTDNWEAFRDALTGMYSELRVGGTNGPDTTCSDPAAIAAIANALNTDTAASIPCDGNTWQIGTCGGVELSIDVAICSCQATSAFTLRPNAGVADNWGGIGGTCGAASGGGASQNISQTLNVTATEIGLPTEADISLTLSPASTSPAVGSNIFIDVNLSNLGPASGTGVSVDFDLPTGLTFVSDDAGGAYNPATGVWTVGTIAAGSDPRLRVIVEVQSTGSYALLAEVLTANENDPDSTPGNAGTNAAEDDTDSVTLTPATPPPPLFCLGRPIQPLIFANPIPESPGASVANPQVGDIFRFPNASPGVDALVQVTAFNNGASLAGIDNDGTPGAPVGVPNNFQPTLVGPAGDVSVDFQFTFVSSGTSTAGTLDFAGSAIDVDGNSAGLREYVEVSDNIVEFALNGVPVPADPTGPPTRLITQANTPPDPGASAPSSGTRIRFEAETADTAAGIDPDEPRNIAAAFFTDVSIFEYRIGKLGDATAGRLNSLAFNCPNIDPGTNTGGTLTDEDFGDAPFDSDPAVTPNYGNPIHVIETGIQLGATNTAETAPGDSPTASTDAGDDGVTLPANFEGGTAVTFNADARGAGGFLQVFIDWNIDGDFDDAAEHAVVDLQDNDANDATPIAVTITPPTDTVAGTSFARFRWSTASGVGIQDPAGDGEVEDYQVTLLAAPPVELQATKTTQVFDPNGDGLFAIPGNDVTYTITVSNSGGGAADDDSLFLVDELPPEITFFNGDADGPGPGTDPVNFAELVATGLDPFVFANDVGFSDDAAAPVDFVACDYDPVVGFDPAVTYICFNPKGTFLAGDPDPSFSVSFRARIR